MGVCPGRVLLVLEPFLGLSLLPDHHKVSSFPPPHPFLMMLCLTSGPETMKRADHELKALKPCIKITLSFFKLISVRYFVTAMKS